MSLLLSLLDGAHAGLKGAAADCLSEVLSKRMDAVPKLTLVQSMGIVPRCAAWAGGFPGTADDEQLSLRLARLLATLATEIIDSLKRLENGGVGSGGRAGEMVGQVGPGARRRGRQDREKRDRRVWRGKGRHRS